MNTACVHSSEGTWFNGFFKNIFWTTMVRRSIKAEYLYVIPSEITLYQVA